MLHAEYRAEPREHVCKHSMLSLSRHPYLNAEWLDGEQLVVHHLKQRDAGHQVTVHYVVQLIRIEAL